MRDKWRPPRQAADRTRVEERRSADGEQRVDDRLRDVACRDHALAQHLLPVFPARECVKANEGTSDHDID